MRIRRVAGERLRRQRSLAEPGSQPLVEDVERHGGSVQLRDGRAGPQPGEHLITGARDVAGAEGEHQVARTNGLQQRVGQAVASRDQAHVEMAAPLQRLDQGLARDARRSDVRRPGRCR